MMQFCKHCNKWFSGKVCYRCGDTFSDQDYDKEEIRGYCECGNPIYLNDDKCTECINEEINNNLNKYGEHSEDEDR